MTIPLAKFRLSPYSWDVPALKHCFPPSPFLLHAVQPPPGLSFLHSFPPFLIASPQLPEMAAGT